MFDFMYRFCAMIYAQQASLPNKRRYSTSLSFIVLAHISVSSKLDFSQFYCASLHIVE